MLDLAPALNCLRTRRDELKHVLAELRAEIHPLPAFAAQYKERLRRLERQYLSVLSAIAILNLHQARP